MPNSADNTNESSTSTFATTDGVRIEYTNGVARMIHEGESTQPRPTQIRSVPVPEFTTTTYTGNTEDDEEEEYFTEVDGNDDIDSFHERMRRRNRERGAEQGGITMASKNKEQLSPGTFGIEFEINNVRRLRKKLPSGWQYTNDISIQSSSPTFRGKPLKCNSKKRIALQNDDRLGIEIVSPILDDFSDVVTVLDMIKETGVKVDSKDCGIHLHVSFPPSPAIIPLFKLGLKYEPLFYVLGTFGKYSRGKYKDFIYQRPLVYPPIVKIARTNADLENGHIFYGHVFDTEKFAEVKDLEDFQCFLGGNMGTRYHPAKYCGINYYSSFYRSTIELRTFNLTTNYSYLKAAVNFSRDFVFAGIREYYEKKEGEDITINFMNDMTKEDIQRLFDEFRERYCNFIDEEDIYTINKIISNAPDIKIEELVYFHLLFHRNGDNTNVFKYRRKKFLPEEVATRKIKQPVTEQVEEYDFEGALCAN